MITYSDLYELLRKEKYNEQLQLMPKNFLKEMAEYFEDKKKLSLKENDDFSDTIIKTKKQLENAVTVMKELMTRRQKKIINLALVAAKTGISKRDAENMLEIEQTLFEAVTMEIEKNEKLIIGTVNGVHKEKDLKNQLVRFKQDTPEFLDVDEQKLGPFKSGEIANLPKKITDVLLKADKIELIEDED